MIENGEQDQKYVKTRNAPRVSEMQCHSIIKRAPQVNKESKRHSQSIKELTRLSPNARGISLSLLLTHLTSLDNIQCLRAH